MPRYVVDIETDGLLMECTRMWVMVAYDLDTHMSEYWLEGDLGWMDKLKDAKLFIGHNVLGFDLFVLKKLFGFELPKDCRVHDTMIMSQILDYRRFGMDGHSLARWMEHFGEKKVEITDWSYFDEVKLHRCITDVSGNVQAYHDLVQEYSELAGKMPMLKHYMLAEHAAAKWSTQAQLHGWPFDKSGAEVLEVQLSAKMQEAYTALSARLGTKTVPYDKAKGEVEPKKPKWTKAGCYDAHTARWFDIDPYSGFEGEERMVEGPYSRVTFEPLSLDSVADVKVFLFRNGWVPTEFNMKDDPAHPGRKIQGSPKITEDSLEFLGGDGKLYTEFLTAKARHSILKTWLLNTDSQGMLHGDCMVIGTPSMRTRHSIIVNVPGADSAWGKEMRSLFGALPGWSLIGCDSAGNQARGLAHYLGDAEFIDILLNGDIHQYNADILTDIVRGMGAKYKDFVVKRSQAKRILYAFLFGASGAKLWSYIFGVLDKKQGQVLKNGFIKAVPGFKSLLEKLENIYGSTSQMGYGYIPSIVGNRIYVDSFHKLLVYLLQSLEKITCATALMLTAEGLEREGIPYVPCIFYHDEIDFMVPDEFAERAAQIGKASFKDGPALYGITIMDGEAKIGKNWYEVH